MNFKLISLIFSGVTLAGGTTAVAVIKNKDSSSLSKPTTLDLNDQRDVNGSDSHLGNSAEESLEAQKENGAITQTSVSEKRTPEQIENTEINNGVSEDGQIKK